MGASPGRAAHAALDAPSHPRKHRPTSARNSAFLVGNSRNKYGWLIPAPRATSSVEVPPSPCAANSGTAASSTISRRSAAGIRCLVCTVMRTKLVITHYFVKGGGQEAMLHPHQHCRGGLRQVPGRHETGHSLRWNALEPGFHAVGAGGRAGAVVGFGHAVSAGQG